MGGTFVVVGYRNCGLLEGLPRPKFGGSHSERNACAGDLAEDHVGITGGEVPLTPFRNPFFSATSLPCRRRLNRKYIFQTDTPE